MAITMAEYDAILNSHQSEFALHFIMKERIIFVIHLDNPFNFGYIQSIYDSIHFARISVIISQNVCVWLHLIWGLIKNQFHPVTIAVRIRPITGNVEPASVVFKQNSMDSTNWFTYFNISHSVFSSLNRMQQNNRCISFVNRTQSS